MHKYLDWMKIFFKTIFQSTKKAVCSFFKSIISFLKTGKKTIAVQSLLFSAFLISSVSICFTTSYFNINIGTNLEKIASEFANETNSNPNVVVHYHQVVNTYDDIVYTNPEFSREVRNVFNVKCYDLYGGWKNSMGIPGVVDYLDSTNENVTFIKWPKFSYTASYWLYEMPLISPSNIPNNSSPTDIFINKKYADKLIFDYGLSDYSMLINKNINIPFLKKSSIDDTGSKVDMQYVIKGILKDSQEYNKISMLYGDFFIVSELLNLPIPSYTHVSLGKQSEYIKIFDFLLKRYNYETNRNYLGSNTSQETFQCRISLHGEINSEYSIKYIENNLHKYSIKTSKLFDAFVGVSNLIPIIFGLLMFSFSFGLLIFFSQRILKILNENNIKSHYPIFAFNAIVILLESAIGLILGKYLVGLYSGFAIIAINPLSLLLIILESFLLLAILFVTKKKEK